MWGPGTPCPAWPSTWAIPRCTTRRRNSGLTFTAKFIIHSERLRPDQRLKCPANGSMRRCAGATLEELFLAHAGGDGYVEEAHHHLVPGLVAPNHSSIGIGIMRVVGGVVVPGNRLQLGAGGQKTRLRQAIAELPVKIPIHLEQRFHPPIGMNQVVLKALAAQMHVGEKAEQGA